MPTNPDIDKLLKLIDSWKPDQGSLLYKCRAALEAAREAVEIVEHLDRQNSLEVKTAREVVRQNRSAEVGEAK